jgi:predicted RNA-binding protein with PIN domain
VAGLRYVIDGYNLAHRIPAIAAMLGSDLERARERLVDRLAGFAAVRRARVTVVFDGTGFKGSRGQGFKGVEVVYSRSPESADKRIMALIERERKVRSWVVVSSDNAIKRHARDYGAKIMTSDEFAALLDAPPPRPRRVTREEPKLSAAEVDEWLRYFRTGRSE